MPRKINPLAVAAGKLILAIQEAGTKAVDAPGMPSAHEVLSRAHTLQHAAHNSCVQPLLNGRSVAAYLDTAWVEMHPSIRPSIDDFTAQLIVQERK